MIISWKGREKIFLSVTAVIILCILAGYAGKEADPNPANSSTMPVQEVGNIESDQIISEQEGFDFFAEYRMERERMRSREVETLKEVINKEDGIGYYFSKQETQQISTQVLKVKIPLPLDEIAYPFLYRITLQIAGHLTVQLLFVAVQKFHIQTLYAVLQGKYCFIASIISSLDYANSQQTYQTAYYYNEDRFGMHGYLYLPAIE